MMKNTLADGGRINLEATQEMLKSVDLQITTKTITKEQIEEIIDCVLERDTYTVAQIKFVREVRMALSFDNFDVAMAQKFARRCNLKIGTTREQIERVVDHILEEAQN